MSVSLRRMSGLSGRRCENLKPLPQPVSGLGERMATVPPAILSSPCLPMTRPVPWTRICTRTASFLTQPLIRSRNAGRRFRITNCCVRENMPRTSITTNCPANCGALVIEFATRCGVIFKSRVFPKAFANVFPSGARRLMKDFKSCWPKNRNVRGVI